MPGWLLLTSSPEREGSTGQVLIFLATLSLARIAPVLDVASSQPLKLQEGVSLIARCAYAISRIPSLCLVLAGWAASRH